MTISDTRLSYGLNFGGTSNVVASASWTSPIFDTLSAGFANQWANYIASQTAPAGSSITWTFRSGDNSALSDAGAYTATVSGLTKRYIQALATIAKDDSSATNNPSVDSIAVNANSVGQGVMVEEGTTNLVAADASNFEVTSSGWSSNGAGATIARSSYDAYEGRYCLQVYTSTTSGAGAYGSLTRAITVGEKYTFSAYAKGTPGQTILYEARRTGGFGISGGTKTVTFDGTWQRVYITGIADITGTTDIFLVFASQSAVPVTFYVDCYQIEQKAYATSWILGGTTRNAESITIPSAAMNPISWTTIIRAYFSGDKLLAAPVGTYNIFGIFPGASGYVRAERSANSFGVDCTSSFGAYQSAKYNPGVITEGWHTVAIRASSGELSFWFDGVKKAFLNAPTLPATISTNPTIGNLASSEYWDDLIDDVLISNRALTDTELVAMTTSGAVISGDYSTTYHLRCDNNLLHGESGYRLSTAVDLTNIGTIGGSNVSWAETEGWSSGAITLINCVNGTVTGGNSFKKTGGTTQTWGDCGFFSTDFLASGQNGFVQFTTAETNTDKMVGFSNSDTDQNYASIKYALHAGSDGNLYVRELGVAKGTSYGTYSAGDSLRIEVVDGVVVYKKNGITFYTSLSAPTYPLFIDGSIEDSNGTVNNVILGKYVKVDVDVSIDNGTTYSACTNGATIPGLTAGVSAAGKNLIFRQKIGSPNAANVNGTLDSVTVKIAQTTSTQDVLIKPVFNKMLMTPSNVDHWQFENKAFKTSYYPGTRNAETLTIPATISNSPIFNLASGAVVVRAFVDGDAAASTVTGTHRLFDIQGTTGNRMLLDITTGTPGTVRWRVNGVNALYTAQLATGWHTFGARWKGTQIDLYVDGVFRATATTTISTNLTLTNLFIGCDTTGTSQWDNRISQVDIFREDLTDAEMVAYTAATGAVIGITNKHSYQLLLEGNLDYATCGIYTSKWLDAGANAAATPWINFKHTEVVPSGTSIEYWFRASDTKDGNAVFYNSITNPGVIGRFCQIRAFMKTNDATTISPYFTAMEPVPKFS